MIKAVPQAFFKAPHPYPQLYHDGASCILYKSVTAPAFSTHNFVSCPALTFVQRGRKLLTPDEGKLITVAASQWAFIPPDLYLVQDLKPEGGAFESWLFFFSEPVLQRFLSSLPATGRNGFTAASASVHPVPVWAHTSPLATYLEGLKMLFEDDISLTPAFLHIKLQELLHLATLGPEGSPFLQALAAIKPRRRNIRAFMEAHYDKPLRVEDYASLTGRSLTSFQRDFKSLTGHTPKQWLMQKRLEKARQLLEKGQQSVTEVAYEVGYENLSHFIKAYGDRYGQSPKQYLIQQRRQDMA